MKRRAKNEGSLFFRKNIGLWVGEITPPTGRKKTRYGKTQAEVKRWLLDQRKLIQEGNYITDDSQTVETFLKRYIKDVATNKLSPRTLISYKSLIKNHILPEIGSVKLSQLRPEHLQSLYTKKIDQGLSKRTVQYIHQFIHTSLHIAYKWGLVLRNVADLVEPPVSEHKIHTILNVAQIREFLKYLRNDRLYPLYVCAVSLGLREGELLALEWDDVDFKAKTISISKQLQYIPGQGFSVKVPKTSSSIRTLPLPDVALKALLEQKEKAGNALVFSTGNGTHFSPRNILRHFQLTLAKMGLPKIHFTTCDIVVQVII